MYQENAINNIVTQFSRYRYPDEDLKASELP